MRLSIKLHDGSRVVVQDQNEVNVANSDLLAAEELASVSFRRIDNLRFEHDLTLSALSRIHDIRDCTITQYPEDPLVKLAIEEIAY